MPPLHDPGLPRHANAFLMNICLIPDTQDETAIDFAANAQTVSNWAHQNTLVLPGPLPCGSKATYLLGPPMTQDFLHSVPHCTLSHIRVPQDEQTIQSLATALSPFAARRIHLDVQGIIYQGNLRPFDRNAILSENQETLFEGREIDTIGYHINRTTALEQLQSAVTDAVLGPKGPLAPQDIQTPQGQDYSPHVTLYAAFHRMTGMNAVPFGEIRAFKQVPFTLAFGDVGPAGQVRKTTRNAADMAALMAPAPRG